MENNAIKTNIIGSLLWITSLFAPILGPLIIWLLFKDDPLIDRIGKNYFNFSVSYFIWVAIATVLMIILIGYVLNAILGVLIIVFSIIGAIHAYNFKAYLPPLSIRFI